MQQRNVHVVFVYKYKPQGSSGACNDLGWVTLPWSIIYAVLSGPHRAQISQLQFLQAALSAHLNVTVNTESDWSRVMPQTHVHVYFQKSTRIISSPDRRDPWAVTRLTSGCSLQTSFSFLNSNSANCGSVIFDQITTWFDWIDIFTIWCNASS